MKDANGVDVVVGDKVVCLTRGAGGRGKVLKVRVINPRTTPARERSGRTMT